MNGARGERGEGWMYRGMERDGKELAEEDGEERGKQQGDRLWEG